jgi:uncharacterized membrane protein
MLDQLLHAVVPTIVSAIELTGVAIIALGTFITLIQFALSIARHVKVEEAVGTLRSNLGRAILVGLELLVAADIIHTVLVELTLESVAALAGIVIIRTLLSFSLEAEIDGQWPWQRRQQRRAEADK